MAKKHKIYMSGAQHKTGRKLTTVTHPISSSTLTGLLSNPQFVVSYVQKKRFLTMTPAAVLPYMIKDDPPGTRAGALICDSNGRVVSRKLDADANFILSPLTRDTAA